VLVLEGSVRFWLTSSKEPVYSYTKLGRVDNYMSKKQTNTVIAVIVGLVAVTIIWAIVKDCLDKHPWAYAVLFGIFVVVLIITVFLLIKFWDSFTNWIKTKFSK
jgi:uncharacterized protein YacL